jgi:hypothetical protein
MRAGSARGGRAGRWAKMPRLLAGEGREVGWRGGSIGALVHWATNALLAGEASRMVGSRARR